MNTKYVMISSAIILAVEGLSFSFSPAEILNYLDTPATTGMILILQISGALFLGFAMLNWMAKGNIIGGIYSRPVAAGNFMHFFIGGIALMKVIVSHPGIKYLLVPTIIYSVSAILFGWILFVHPGNKRK